MSEERIDIEIVDKVDNTIVPKIENIAKASDRGDKAVKRLKAALAAVDANPLTKLANAMAKLEGATARNTAAQARMLEAQNKAAVATARVNTEQQRLATETARTATATANAASAIARKEVAEAKAAMTTAKLAASTSAVNKATSDGITITNARARSVEEIAEAEERFARAQKDWAANSSGWQDAVASQNADYARSQQAVAQATDSAADSTSEMAARALALKNSVDPLGTMLDRYNAELREAEFLKSRNIISDKEFARYQDELVTKIQSVTNAMNAQNQAKLRGVTNAKAMTNATLNLSRQFADIGVTAAMGMNPLMILIQQGPQVADAFQMAGTQGLSMGQVMKGMAGQAMRLLAVIAPLAIAAAGLGVVFAGLHRKMKEGYPKDITEGMGLSEKQLAKVKSRTVTFADTVVAYFKTMGEDIAAGPLGKLWDWFVDKTGWAVDSVFDLMQWMGAQIAGVIGGTASYVGERYDIMLSGMDTSSRKTYNSIISAFQTFVNTKLTGINLIIKALNLIPGVDISPVQIVMPKMAEIASSGTTTGRSFGEHYAQAVQSSVARSEAFMSRVGANALKRAQDRARKEAGDDKGTAKGGRKGAGFDREAELRNINAELDNQLSRMGMLADAREVQNKLDSIAQKFAEKNAHLTDAETAALRAKLETIQEYERVQRAMDSIYSSITEPLKVYNAQIEALSGLQEDGHVTASRYAFELSRINNEYAQSKDIGGLAEETHRYTARMAELALALEEGRISLQRFNQEKRAADYAKATAEDPLFRENESLTDQIKLLGVYGVERERLNYLLTQEQALRERGLSLYDESTGKLTTEAEALAAKYDQLQRGLLLQQQMDAIYSSVVTQTDYVANTAWMYDEIDRLRQQDLISERQAAQMRAKVNQQYSEQRLSNARQMFGDLATLSSSGNKKLAAIGKAAAIAQATIDGYLAVQKALAAAPPPINYMMAGAAAVAAGVQVAGIASTNVGNFKDGGQFTVGGRDGVDKNNINMNVTKGERVTIETPAQQRNTDEALSGSGGPVTVPVTVVNVTDPNEAIAAMDSAAGERVVLNVVSRNPQAFKRILEGA